MKKILVMMVLALALVASPAAAKEGFFVGAFLVPSEDISGEAGQGVDDGSGYGFRVGMGFGKYFSVEGVLERTELDVTGGGTVEMDGIAVNARVNFPLTTLDSAKVMSFEPYVLVGYGMYDATQGGDSNDGSGFRIGVGIEQYLFRELSVNVGYSSTKVTFDTNPEQDGTVRVIEVGLIYHFL